MVDDILEIKEEINHSVIFSIDRKREPSVYQSELFRLVENLYQYVRHLSFKYKDTGLEVVETAHDCLRSYRIENGLFLNYYMVAFKRRYTIESAKEQMEQLRGGIVLTQQEQQKISRILALAKSHQSDMASDKFVEKTAFLLGESASEVQRLLQVHNSAMAAQYLWSSDEYRDESQIANLADDEMVEDLIIDKSEFHDFLLRVNHQFAQCRASQRQVISKLLTAKIIAELPELLELPMLQKSKFWDNALFSEFLYTGEVPTARELAKRLERNEASASRTLNHFLVKVREEDVHGFADLS